MHDVVFAVGSLAAAVSLLAGLRTVRGRGPLWRLLSGTQFGGAIMMILLLISNAAHSATLDSVDVVYALAFSAYAIYVWNAQKRLTAQR